MKRTRILFVDDEAPVLDGLQNLLRKERHRWSMVFARGGEQALVELAKAPFDIVVSDMRMPGMDGGQLLAKVQAQYPGTARLILSGHAEQEAVLRALPVAQQFLSKPCDADLLRSTLDRTSGLRDLLAGDAIRRAAGKLEMLPSVPRTYLELRAAAARPDASAADIAGIIERDPAMSVKVLQLVNSAYFGNARQVSSIAAAAAYLGVELLKGLALTAQAFSAMGDDPVPGFSIERLQNYAILTARLARRFLGNSKRADEAFTAGLVHDVGQIVVAMGAREQFAQAVRESRGSGQPLHLVERALLGVSHAEVGAYLIGSWGLPFSIVECIAYHHRPGDIGAGPTEVLAAVHAADALVDAALDDKTGGGGQPQLDEAFLERAGSTEALPQWRQMAIVEANRAVEAA